MLVRGGARSAPLFLRHRILPLYICSGSSGLGKPQRSLAFAGAVSVAIDRAEDGMAIAAEAAPTKVMLQLNDRQISPMNYLGYTRLSI